MYQLFVFFMITDPATTVKNKKGQILVGPIAMVIHLQLKHRKTAE